MSLSSELILKPGQSRVYLRLVLILYLISIALIIHSSIYLVIQLILILLIFNQFRIDWAHPSACSTIQEIKYCKSEWVLIMENGTSQHFDIARILIHNMLFQVIQLTHPKRNKLLILFNDQIPKTQLRLLHLKTTTI